MPRLGDIFKKPNNGDNQQKNNAPKRAEFELPPSKKHYIKLPDEWQAWARVYYELGFTPMVCYQTKNPAYRKWEEFKRKRPPLEYLLYETTYHQDPSLALLGIVQTYDNARFLIIDIDDMAQVQKLEFAPDRKTLIEPTNRGIHILVRMENYDPLILGDKRKIGAIDLLFVHNTIVAPSQIGKVKRGWRYLSVEEAVRCKLTDSWPRELTPDEFASLIESDEIIHIDLKNFGLTKRFFESSERSSQAGRDLSPVPGGRARLIQEIQQKLIELNQKYRFYRPGLRHEFALRVSAMARKCPAGFTYDETLQILSPFFENDEEKEDRRTAVFDTYKEDVEHINYSDLLTALYCKFTESDALQIYREVRSVFFGAPKQAPETEKLASKPKLQRYFESYLSLYSDALFRTEHLLYKWDGKYLKTLSVHEFARNFLDFVQIHLNEVTTDYYAAQVYKNLLACSEIKELPEWGDVVAFENLVFNLRKLTFEPHSIEHANRFFVRANVIPGLFYDALTEPTWVDRYKYVIDRAPNFKRYLTTLEFDDLTLQQFIEMIGYAMLPRLRKYNLEVCFVMFGEGANGKSTATQLIQRLFAGFFSSVSLSDLEGFSLSSLLNSYLNIANEITEKHDKTLAVENFKRTVSWDVMDIPIKFQPHVEASLPLIHIFAVNQKPRINEFTYAVYRRFNFIHFSKIIPEEERDQEMGDKLWAERDYIVTAALLGALKVADERRLENNIELLNLTMLANNPLVGFLLENYEPVDTAGRFDEGAVQKIADLRNHFHQFEPLSRFKNNSTFSPALKQAIEFIAKNYDARWANVKIHPDTRKVKEFEGRCFYDVVYPLKRVGEA